MERISILEFFKTGKFGDVELNFSKSKTISLIGKNIKYNTCMNGEILKYQNIEFHFFDDALFMIFCDSLNFAYEDLSVGEGINFDNWIFKKAKRFSFTQMKQELKKENIAFITKEKKIE